MAQETKQQTKRNGQDQHQGNKPVRVYKAKGMRASVFANDTDKDGERMTYHKVSLVRVYKEGEAFKTTSALSRDDIPVARLLLARAWEFILETESNHPQETESSGD